MGDLTVHPLWATFPSYRILSNLLKVDRDYHKDGIYNLAIKTWQQNIFNSLKKQMTDKNQRMSEMIQFQQDVKDSLYLPSVDVLFRIQV